MMPPDKIPGDKYDEAMRLREDFEKFFRHTELGEIKKEAYGIVFVYESGNQASYDVVIVNL